MKKTLTYFLLVLFSLTSGYGTFYCLAKKVFAKSELVSIEFESTEEDQKEEKEKEEKETEKEKEKNGFFDCFFEYDTNTFDLLNGGSYFSDPANVFPASDYRAEVFSPPELAAI